MIFVTIGTQAPFNRLIRLIEDIAPQLNGEEIIVQAFGIDFKPVRVKVVELIPADEFNSLFKQARLVISHAGMGNIISALQFKKPIIIIPRKAALGEHRNDHQIATAKNF